MEVNELSETKLKYLATQSHEKISTQFYTSLHWLSTFAVMCVSFILLFFLDQTRVGNFNPVELNVTLVFWFVTGNGLVGSNQHFRETQCLHLQLLTL